MSTVIEKFKKVITHPQSIGIFALEQRPAKRLSDKTFVSLEYWLTVGKKLELKNPTTFNEKLQWLKLYDHNPDYTAYVDKYEVRSLIENRIGKQYLVPIIELFESVEQIKYSSLPSQFVLKPTHTSGNIFICHNKDNLDVQLVNRKMVSWLKRDYYWAHREWPYRNIKPRIICEPLLVDESGFELKDYKILCFNGIPKIIQVMSGRSERQFYLNHFDINWNPVTIERLDHSSLDPSNIARPKRLDEMIDIARILSDGFSFVRVDFYHTPEKLYFGELTFFPASGMIPFKDDSVDQKWGSWLNIIH